MKNRFLKLNINKKSYFLFLLLTFFIFPFLTKGATISVSTIPNINVNSTFDLVVKINTLNKNINNAEGNLYYPKDLVDVVSISKTNSIFNLWITEPTDSKAGTISFNGGIKTPGFNGSAGTVFSVKFKAKKTGNANFYFANHSIRENDGLGTNILSGQSGAIIKIIDTPKKEEIVPKIETITTANLDKLLIFSNTHPEQDKWYNLKEAYFSWENPKGVLAISTLLDNSSNSIPSTKSTLVVSDKTKELSEGIQYFHVIYKTKDGWSIPTHYTLKTDFSEPSEVNANYLKDNNNRYVLNLKAKDDLSGISHFNLKIANYDEINIPAVDNMANYLLPDLYFGKNVIEISAFDFAGNKKSIKFEINVDTLIKPEILSCNQNIKIGEAIQINGKTKYPELSSFVYLISPNGKITKYLLEINKDGYFNAITDKLYQEGKYTAWIKIFTDDGSYYVESDYLDIKAGFSLFNYILSSPVLIISIIFFIFSIFILLLAIHLLRLHKNKVVENKRSIFH